MVTVLTMRNVITRDGVYYFRIAVPKDCQAVIGSTEITRSLKTKDAAKDRKEFSYRITGSTEFQGLEKSVFIGVHPWLKFPIQLRAPVHLPFFLQPLR